MIAMNTQFQQLLEECSIEAARQLFFYLRLRSFSSCQKNVVLKLQFDRAPVLCTLESFSSCQKNVVLKPQCVCYFVYLFPFQQLLEECSIEAISPRRKIAWCHGFSSCQKNVVLKLLSVVNVMKFLLSFSSCQKNVVLKPPDARLQRPEYLGFQQLLEECSIEAP